MLKTRVFELPNGRYQNLSELAQAMGMSVSEIYRVRGGKRNINQKFIVGAIKAFPNYKLDDLFYLAPEPPTVNNHPQHSITHSTDETVSKEKQRTESTQQALDKFASATNKYAQHLKSHTSATISLREASQEIKRSSELANKVLSYLEVHAA